MKHSLLVGFAVSVLFAAPAVASAQSVESLREQIRVLLEQVSQLQVQLTQRLASSTVSQVKPPTLPMPSMPLPQSYKPAVCGMLDKTMVPGERGVGVTYLQDFLKDKGFLQEGSTGYFGSLTTKALQQWQMSEGVVSSAREGGAGVFGPRTRDRLRVWCAQETGFRVTPKSGTAPLTVTAYANVGGKNLYTYKVDFGDGSSSESIYCYAPLDVCERPGQLSHTYASDGTYTVSLLRTRIQATTTETVAREVVKVGTSPVACTREYQPVCGSKPIVCITTPCNPIQQTYGNRCTMNADGATFVHEGQCVNPNTQNPSDNPQCKSWYDGCNTCSRTTPGGVAMCTLRACTPESTERPYCTTYFEGTRSGAPVISQFSGPVQLSVNELGTWRITASDPENEQLTYRIVWGDEWTNADSAVRALAPSFNIQQDTSFTHSYSRAGTYTVALTVSDPTGKEARATATVTVTQTACQDIYEPVCGRPIGCANTCPAGMYCAMVCQQYQAQTYSNRCAMANANAEIVHTGACTGQE